MARPKTATDADLWKSLDILSSVSPASTSGAAEEIADQIQQTIINGNLEEGARLPSERDLARILSTSRPTVSQAIRILVVKGVVHTRRGSGAFVARRSGEGLAASVNLMLGLDRVSAPHLNELRLWLETAGVTEAIQRATDDEVREGEAALQRLQESTGDTSAWMSADTHFHATLVRASHNPYLASIYESVHAALIRYEHRDWIDRGTVPVWMTADDADAVTAIHQPILDAIRDRDEEAGRRAVQRHHEAMARHLSASHD
ncbi:GntR family transcriptional repressor for pyruvate dehydrogenase complex [Amorphus suaedae]